MSAATFGRLCVETQLVVYGDLQIYAAASARLCVETPNIVLVSMFSIAAAFARLCVETRVTIKTMGLALRSRLRAAMC